MPENRPKQLAKWKKRHYEEAYNAYPYQVQEGWRDKANCKGLNPSMFLIARGEATYDGVAVCAGCSVRLDCVYDNLGEYDGIWGGLVGRDRRALRKLAADNGERIVGAPRPRSLS